MIDPVDVNLYILYNPEVVTVGDPVVDTAVAFVFKITTPLPPFLPAPPPPPNPSVPAVEVVSETVYLVPPLPPPPNHQRLLQILEYHGYRHRHQRNKLMYLL